MLYLALAKSIPPINAAQAVAKLGLGALGGTGPLA